MEDNKKISSLLSLFEALSDKEKKMVLQQISIEKAKSKTDNQQ